MCGISTLRLHFGTSLVIVSHSNVQTHWIGASYSALLLLRNVLVVWVSLRELKERKSYSQTSYELCFWTSKDLPICKWCQWYILHFSARGSIPVDSYGIYWTLSLPSLVIKQSTDLIVVHSSGSVCSPVTNTCLPCYSDSISKTCAFVLNELSKFAMTHWALQMIFPDRAAYWYSTRSSS